MFKGVARAGNLFTFDLGSCLPCECSLGCRDSLGWVRAAAQCRGLQHPCPETVQQGDTWGLGVRVCWAETFAEFRSCWGAAGAGCRGRDTQPLELRGHRQSTHDIHGDLCPTDLGKAQHTWLFSHVLLDMVCSEEVLLCLRVFCCLWLSLTFPCWGKQMNILRVTPRCKR